MRLEAHAGRAPLVAIRMLAYAAAGLVSHITHKTFNDVFNEAGVRIQIFVGVL